MPEFSARSGPCRALDSRFIDTCGDTLPDTTEVAESPAPRSAVGMQRHARGRTSVPSAVLRERGSNLARAPQRRSCWILIPFARRNGSLRHSWSVCRPPAGANRPRTQEVARRGTWHLQPTGDPHLCDSRHRWLSSGMQGRSRNTVFALTPAYATRDTARRSRDSRGPLGHVQS
jgi:hypothetical protein